MIEKWKTFDSQFRGNYKVFDIYTKKREHPITKKTGEFTALAANDWVNIIPITAEKEVIFVEQYRHGIDEISLEIPAGVMEIGENPRDAAERECKEETGFVGKKAAIFLGKVRPNPAFLNNFCHLFLWLDCEQKFTQNLDENEDIRILKIPLAEIKNMILDGKINHSLAIDAFFYLSISEFASEFKI